MWKGESFIGETWMAYRGSADDNHAHAHATLQLTISLGDPITICDADGKPKTGGALCVRAGEKHTLHPASRIVLLLVEPQSDMARTISDHSGKGPVSEVEDTFTSRVDWTGDLESLADRLIDPVGEGRPYRLDPRLEIALGFLRTAELRGAVSRAAKLSGLSEPRLRAIASAQMGVPLSKWVTWQAIRRAAEALSGGASLVEAAYSAGFADQAHYSRTMRKLMGITPLQASKSASE